MAVGGAGTESNIIEVSPNGRMVATLREAKALAEPGDTIVVYPGTYDEGNLLKNGVNWFFMPGAIVYYNNPSITSGNARGIFDDRDTGAVTCRIGGFGEFVFNAGMAAFSGSPNYAPVNGPAALIGGIVIQNAGSNITIQCRSVKVRSFFAFPTYVWAVYVLNCVQFDLTCNEIDDPGFNTSVQIGVDGDTNPVLVISNTSGVYWERGETYVRSGLLRAQQLAFWGTRPVGSAANNLWMTVDLMQNVGSQSVMYVDDAAGGPTEQNWKTWIHVKEIRGGIDATGGYSIFAGGKHYINVDKISSLAAGSAAISIQVAASEVWLTSQKVSSTSKGIRVNASGVTLYATVLQIEDLGGMTTAIEMQAGTARIQGPWMKVLNGNGVTHSGGALRLLGATIDTSNTAAKLGVVATAAGLVLGGCTIKTGTGAAVGNAGTTVKCFPPCIGNIAATATIQGTLTIDTNLA